MKAGEMNAVKDIVYLHVSFDPVEKRVISLNTINLLALVVEMYVLCGTGIGCPYVFT
jgi:hypothetical protein